MEKMNDLESRINELYEKDQTMIQSRVWDDSVVEESTKFVKEFIEEYGWPKISEFGWLTAHRIWLFVQHSLDKDFMKQCLKMMEDLKNLNPEEIRIEDWALLTDRLLMYDGKPQLYGSQVLYDDDGNSYIYDSEEGVNERRKELGLEPVEKYLKIFKKR